MFEFVPLTVEQDQARVLDLCLRATDYIELETGKQPDAKYVQKTLTEAPPQLTSDDVFAVGFARPDRTLAGFVTYLRHFYERNEWYIGLLILDPAERSKGLGGTAAQYVFDHAKSEAGSKIRIAVLQSNPRGRKFWESHGFKHERAVPADQNDDGHERHVLLKVF